MCDSDTSSCLGLYLMGTCSKFHIGFRLDRELLPCPCMLPVVHGAMGYDEESFIIVWWWHQLLSRSLPNGRLSRVLSWLQPRPRTFHLALVLWLALCQYMPSSSMYFTCFPMLQACINHNFQCGWNYVRFICEKCRWKSRKIIADTSD